MNSKIRLGIADDHVLLRAGLIGLLNEFEEINVLFDVGNGKELLEKLKAHPIDVLLLDLEMPIMDGFEVFEKMKVKHPLVKIIIVSSHYKDVYIKEFMKKGAASFLGKNASVETIVKAIKDVHKNSFYHDNYVSAILAKAVAESNQLIPDLSQPVLNLTDQEIAIIRLICMNKTSKEIADKLFISVRTVEGHRLHIRQKTNCKNQIDLTAFSIQNRLINFS